MSSKEAKLIFNSKEANLPIYTGTLGPEVIDVTQVGKHDVFTFDPGYMSTASCESKITFIDGDKGILLHRGYPIDQLAEKCDFLTVVYLLLFGELPTANEKQSFDKIIQEYSHIGEPLPNVFTGFKQDAHPMAMMIGMAGALSAFYPESSDIFNEEQRKTSAYHLIAKIPTIAAMAYQYLNQKAFIRPQSNFSYTENFYHMMFGHAENKKPNAVLTRALDKIFILHADHEQNASTSTVRMTGSTGVNPFACVAAGIGALWGPAHGGANEACLNMLKQIGNESKIEKYIARAKDKNDPFRLMGFGHRVYKNYDPRAKVMRETCHEVLAELGVHDTPLFKLAMKLEKIALEDEYFIQRKLYPNVDFYSGITLSALGIPANMFTVMFALARTAGWMANWMEMMSDPNPRLARPRQLYTGHTKRDVPLD